MKIAVTSASGKLGAAIVTELIAAIGPASLIGIARSPEKARHLGVEIRQGDYNNRAHFDHALQDIDTLLLVSGMDDPQLRIQQHRNVIEAAKLNGVKKIVYTSIVGDEKRTAFNTVVNSNRQTEADIRNSGLEWVIGRNGIYIEPDLEYIDQYVKAGEISNCAADGKCAYTSRGELAYAYTQMLLSDIHNGHTYNLVGQPISQLQLAELLNIAYGTKLSYRPVSVAEYQAERQAALGDFIGTIIAGIYEGIRLGAYDIASDYEQAAGRAHKAPLAMIQASKDA